jgi:hypothetical protein
VPERREPVCVDRDVERSGGALAEALERQRLDPGGQAGRHVGRRPVVCHARATGAADALVREGPLEPALGGGRSARDPERDRRDAALRERDVDEQADVGRHAGRQGERVALPRERALRERAPWSDRVDGRQRRQERCADRRDRREDSRRPARPRREAGAEHVGTDQDPADDGQDGGGHAVRDGAGHEENAVDDEDPDGGPRERAPREQVREAGRGGVRGGGRLGQGRSGG